MTNLNKLTDVINYDTDMDALIRIQYKCGFVQNGYVLDFDEPCRNSKDWAEPRFVFEDLGSGEISEEYFAEIENAMIITGGAK